MAACLEVQGRLEEALGIDITIAPSSLIDPESDETISSCRLSGSGLTGLDASDELVPILDAMGWQRDIRCDADGPDGTSGAHRREAVICIHSVWMEGESGSIILDCAVDPSRSGSLRIQS